MQWFMLSREDTTYVFPQQNISQLRGAWRGPRHVQKLWKIFSVFLSKVLVSAWPFPSTSIYFIWFEQLCWYNRLSWILLDDTVVHRMFCSKILLKNMIFYIRNSVKLSGRLDMKRYTATSHRLLKILSTLKRRRQMELKMKHQKFPLYTTIKYIIRAVIIANFYRQFARWLL